MNTFLGSIKIFVVDVMLKWFQGVPSLVEVKYLCWLSWFKMVTLGRMNCNYQWSDLLKADCSFPNGLLEIECADVSSCCMDYCMKRVVLYCNGDQCVEIFLNMMFEYVDEQGFSIISPDVVFCRKVLRNVSNSRIETALKSLTNTRRF